MTSTGRSMTQRPTLSRDAVGRPITAFEIDVRADGAYLKCQCGHRHRASMESMLAVNRKPAHVVCVSCGGVGFVFFPFEI